MKKSNSILCIGPEWRGSNAGALFKALGKIGKTFNTSDELAKFLKNAIADKGILTLDSSEKIKKYSRQNTSKQLAEVLDSVL